MNARRLALAACLFVGACSSGRPGHGFAPTDGGSTSNPGSGEFTSQDGGPTDGGDCSDSAKLVYLVDEDSTLYSFTPSTTTFTTIGTLTCNAQFGSTPFSMSVDRSANAWVLYNSGEMFEVSTKDASCQSTTHTAGLEGLENFGMGFASNSSGSTDDTLYVAGGAADDAGTLTSTTFATMTVPALVPSKVGTIQGWPELTGTGAGDLWGFFPSDTITPRVSKLDKTTGQDGTVFMLDALSGTPTAWAFAFWGGDFYVFLEKDDDLSTTVYKVDGTSGALTTQKKDTGKTIVGAGVSTCAPLTIQ